MKKKQHPKLPIGEHTLQHVAQTVPKTERELLIPNSLCFRERA